MTALSPTRLFRRIYAERQLTNNFSRLIVAEWMKGTGSDIAVISLKGRPTKEADSADDLHCLSNNIDSSIRRDVFRHNDAG